MMKSWFKKVKCPVCLTKHKELKNELRLDTVEGVHSMFICDDCSEFFDKSAEVLKKRNSGKSTDPIYTEIDDVNEMGRGEESEDT